MGSGRRLLAAAVAAVSGRRVLGVALVALAAGAAAVGAVVGAGSGGEQEPRGAPASRPAQGSSFLARLLPPADRGERPGRRPPPSGAAGLARGLAIERKVAQLFVLGFEGTDLNAEIFQRLRTLDLGGILIARRNYTSADLLGQMAGEAAVIAREEGHVEPWVLASQLGGELNAFPDLPPTTTPAQLTSAEEAAQAAAETASALTQLGVNGVLGPVVDVGFEGSAAVGEEVYSDDPAEVSGYAGAVIRAYEAEGLFAAVGHFPGLGTADQSTEQGPASVGLELSQLRRRDLLPFRAAIEDGARGVLLSHALYPLNDFTAPASMSRVVATDLLRVELGFGGLAITDDLTAPAITTVATVTGAAVAAVRAGADMLLISGPVEDQAAAYDAVLRAARDGRIPRARLDEAVDRVLTVKREYGLAAP